MVGNGCPSSALDDMNANTRKTIGIKKPKKNDNAMFAKPVGIQKKILRLLEGDGIHFGLTVPVQCTVPFFFLLPYLSFRLTCRYLWVVVVR